MTVLFLSRYSWRDHYFTNTVKKPDTKLSLHWKMWLRG